MTTPHPNELGFLRYAMDALIQHYEKTCPDDKTMHDKLLRQLTGVEGWTRYRTTDTLMRCVLNELIKYMFSQVMIDSYTLYSTGYGNKTREKIQPIISCIMRGLHV